MVNISLKDCLPTFNLPYRIYHALNKNTSEYRSPMGYDHFLSLPSFPISFRGNNYCRFFMILHSSNQYKVVKNHDMC